MQKAHFNPPQLQSHQIFRSKKNFKSYCVGLPPLFYYLYSFIEQPFHLLSQFMATILHQQVSIIISNLLFSTKHFCWDISSRTKSLEYISFANTIQITTMWCIYNQGLSNSRDSLRIRKCSEFSMVALSKVTSQIS